MGPLASRAFRRHCLRAHFREGCRPVSNGPREKFRRTFRSGVPDLMLDNTFHPATPPRFGQQAAWFLLNSRQVLLSNIAHGYGSDCTRNLIAEFIFRGSVRESNTSCVETLGRQCSSKNCPRGTDVKELGPPGDG